MKLVYSKQMDTMKSHMVIAHRTPRTEALAHYLTEKPSFHCKSRSPRGLLAFSGVNYDIRSKGVSAISPCVKSHIISACELNYSKSCESMNVARYRTSAT